MMPNNRFILLTFVAACGIFDRAASFSNSAIARLAPPKSPRTAVRGASRRTLSSTLFASSALPDERLDNNPSTKFGSPLSDSMKVCMIHLFMQSNVLDFCLFGRDPISIHLLLRSLTPPCQFCTLCKHLEGREQGRSRLYQEQRHRSVLRW